MIVVRLPMALLLTGILSLTGCAYLQPVPLYQLDSGTVEVPGRDGKGPAVLLGPVKVADYLQREALLQRQVDGSLTPARNARWAANLATEIDQQLLRQLAARLDSQRLALAPAAQGFAPQVQVLLSITRLDSGPKRPAVLEAQWRLLNKDGRQLDSRLVRIEEPHQGSIADQVRAQSLVMQQFVQQLARAVQERSGGIPAVAEQPSRKASGETPRVPKIPVAEPIRIESEVFRF